MTADEAELRDNLRQHVKECEEKAAAALDANSPVGAREWYEAASAAMTTIRKLEATDV